MLVHIQSSFCAQILWQSGYLTGVASEHTLKLNCTTNAHYALYWSVFSKSSCGLRATLQSCLFLTCGQRRSSPVSISIIEFQSPDSANGTVNNTTYSQACHQNIWNIFALICVLLTMFSVFNSCSASIGQAVHQLLLIQAFRPDRLLAMSQIVVSKVLGETFMNIIEQPLDLANIVDNEVLSSLFSPFLHGNSHPPILLNLFLTSSLPLCRWSPALQCSCALCQAMMPVAWLEIWLQSRTNTSPPSPLVRKTLSLFG